MQIFDQLIAAVPPGNEAGNGGGAGQPDDAAGFDEAYFGLDAATRLKISAVGQVDAEDQPKAGEPDLPDAKPDGAPDRTAPLAFLFGQEKPADLDPAKTNAPGILSDTPGDRRLPPEDTASETLMPRETAKRQVAVAENLPGATSGDSASWRPGKNTGSVAKAGTPEDATDISAGKNRSSGIAEVKDPAGSDLRLPDIAADRGGQAIRSDVPALLRNVSTSKSDISGPLMTPVAKERSAGAASPDMAAVKPVNANRYFSPASPDQPARDYSRTEKTRTGHPPDQTTPRLASTAMPASTDEFAAGKINGSSDRRRAEPPSTSEPATVSRPVQAATPVSDAGVALVGSVTIRGPADAPQSDIPDTVPLAAADRLQSAMQGLSRPGAGLTRTSAPAARSVSGQIAATVSGMTDGKIEVHLRPAELGRLTIQLSPTENGLSALISAERSEVTELLRRHGEIFRRDLTEMGFTNISMDFEASENGGQAAPPYRNQPAANRFDEMATQEEAAQLLTTAAGITRGGLDIRI